jgi:tRNA(fMet)-specific endonuclease VapC
MGVILDSSVTIRAERIRMTEPQLLEEVRTVTNQEIVGLSAVGVTELVHGIYRADTQLRAANRRRFLEELLEDLDVYDYNLAVARLAGQIDGEQRAIGNSIPFPDLLIGATALSLNFSLLTVNLRHFRMIPNLNVIPF